MEYPSVLRRYLSTTIDCLVLIVLFLVISAMFSQNLELAKIIRVSLILSVIFLYEPLFTSFGCTLGQKVTGIRVRTEKENHSIGVLQAYVRIVFKITLGFISFFSLMLSERKRAIHDLISGTMVIYKNKNA